MKKLTIILFILLIPTLVFAATENLDERIARQARYGQTFYSGEGAAPGYYWQPETLMYSDVTSGKEVWTLVWYPNQQDIYSKEHGAQNPWGYNGNWLGVFQFIPMHRSTNAERGLGSNLGRLLVKADGTKLRIAEGPGRYEWPNDSFSMSWDTNTYYTWDSDTTLYRCTYSENTGVVSSTSLLTISGGASAIEMARNGVFPNRIVATDIYQHTWTPAPPNNISCVGVYFIDNIKTSPTITYKWGMARNQANYDSHSGSEGDMQHAGIYALGPTGTKILSQFEGETLFTEMADHGSASDGGPLWRNWDGDSFGSPEEIWAIDGGGTAPYTPYDYRGGYGYNVGYWGHPCPDRWGKYTMYGNGDEQLTFPGTAIYNHTTHMVIDPPCMGGAEYTADGAHHGWQAWSDYLVGNVYYQGGNFYNRIYMNKYNATYTSEVLLCNTHTKDGGPDNYNAWNRPVQSPDGTKVLHSQIILNSESYPYVGYVVAYNPYPPELYSVTASGGTVTIRFDWGTNSGTWRGYTARKWPNDAGSYLPPRETSKFRLWRSANGTTWVPIKVINADIWTKYNFVDGGYNGGQTSYWTFTDTPGNGTFYYAVTSMEWSGLESRSLSNIYSIVISGGSGTGSQSTAYPSTPGTDSNFYNSFSASYPSLIRYYNIYAQDTTDPTAIQQDRIFSIAHTQWTGATASYRDWLGNTNQSTHYKISAVDTQGNESTLTYVAGQSYAYAGTSGQYNLGWNQMYVAPTEQGEEPPAVPSLTGVSIVGGAIR